MGASLFLGINLEGFSLTGDAFMDYLGFVLAVFVLAVFFFGYLSFIPALLYGVLVGGKFSAEPVFTVASFLPVVAAAYGGIILGRALSEDMNNQGNLTRSAIKAVVMLVFAIGVGVALQYRNELISMTGVF